ncbi:MAG: hypothetical protein HGA65_10780, partial [Oscillochloris sp.]|nr:hypothetical protein [Oscillochloris sp.]
MVSLPITPIGAALVDSDAIHNRPPVAQLFEEQRSGERFSLIVNHFKSKSSCPASGADADQGDGQSCWNATRVAQAQRLLSWINGTLVPTSADPDVLLVGDFNAYAKEDPITTLVNAGYTNLISSFVGAEAYSYVFDGQWGYLDQALASPSLLAQTSGAGDYHINADEPSVLDYNTNYKSAAQIAAFFNADAFRTSDHDPVLIGLGLRPLARAAADSYTVEAGSTLSVNASTGLLANDSGLAPAIISYTQPSHGTLSLTADGALSYTPAPGYTGTDSFSYTLASTTSANGTRLYRSDLALLGTFGGVNITASAYGSALAPVPGSSDEFYGLTDRGPNVDGPSGSKIEPIPSFTPAIGKFKLVDGQAILEQTITLKAADGSPYNGQVSTEANTGETIYDLDGNLLPASPYGYDPEGLVALADGSFWVSDEYGPFITHFAADGTQLARLSPYDGSLPAELKSRVVNRGMEGLAITPDGSTLVGMMQSALQQADLAGSDAKKLTPLRIVTYALASGETHEYLYLLDNPSTTKTAVSEITALSNTTFLVLERDGNALPGAYKKLFLIDISGATDVGPGSSLASASYDAASGGLLVGGKSIELLLKGQNTAAATSTLASSGITPVAKSLYLDLGALLTSLDPQGRFFAHDKIEGVALANSGTQLVIANDSDFGLDGVTNSAAPFQLHAKMTATGEQDEGEFLVIDLADASALVTLNVQDTLAPETIIDSQPTNPSSSAAASFSFSGSDSGAGVASFACSLDGAAFAACTSGVSYSDLADGSHSFAVQAIDGVGNGDATPASVSWMVDTTAPTVSFSEQPTSPINSGAASFAFSSSDAGSGVASVACSLDGAAFAACTSPLSYSGLAKGAHTFQVQAIDQAGNLGSASASWTINAAATSTRFSTSANPAVTGQELTFTARVAVLAPGVGTPAGNVTFLSWGKPIAGCREVALSDGVARCTTSFSHAGAYLIGVRYSGGDYFLASATGPWLQVVKSASQVSLRSSANPSAFGQSVTFTARVRAATRVTGSVTFLDGTTVLATRQLSN